MNALQRDASKFPRLRSTPTPSATLAIYRHRVDAAHGARNSGRFAPCALVAIVAQPIMSTTTGFNIQGHRGARGLRPENSLPGFAYALSVGVTTLEFDVGITADDHLVVIHDRYLNPDIVRDASGQWLSEQGPLLRQLSLNQLREYDIGRINPATDYVQELPHQVAVDGARIPTLEEVVWLTRVAQNTEVRFNIEIKVSPEAPDDTLDPDAFTERVLTEMGRLGITERCTLQSFDWRVPLHCQQIAPEITTGYVSAQQTWYDTIWANVQEPSPWTDRFQYADYAGSLPEMVKAAGGAIWSPYYGELTKKLIAYAHHLDLQVIPWTVNRAEDMRRLIDWSIDGLITDYPDELRKVAVECGQPVPGPTPLDVDESTL